MLDSFQFRCCQRFISFTVFLLMMNQLIDLPCGVPRHVIFFFFKIWKFRRWDTPHIIEFFVKFLRYILTLRIFINLNQTVFISFFRSYYLKIIFLFFNSILYLFNWLRNILVWLSRLKWKLKSYTIIWTWIMCYITSKTDCNFFIYSQPQTVTNLLLNFNIVSFQIRIRNYSIKLYNFAFSFFFNNSWSFFFNSKADNQAFVILFFFYVNMNVNKIILFWKTDCISNQI